MCFKLIISDKPLDHSMAVNKCAETGGKLAELTQNFVTQAYDKSNISLWDLHLQLNNYVVGKCSKLH